MIFSVAGVVGATLRSNCPSIVEVSVPPSPRISVEPPVRNSVLLSSPSFPMVSVLHEAVVLPGMTTLKCSFSPSSAGITAHLEESGTPLSQLPESVQLVPLPTNVVVLLTSQSVRTTAAGLTATTAGPVATKIKQSATSAQVMQIKFMRFMFVNPYESRFEIEPCNCVGQCNAAPDKEAALR
ncbi:MAG: hypothetical protein FLDDKLPJ_03037 [Phycisphaerae bacterium]|nr:hypothetical protein [Phycisphaerae bacterium]